MTKTLPVLVVLAGLAACGSGPSSPRVATAAGAASSTTIAPQSIPQLMRAAAQCLRDHGLPNFPDPTLDARGRIQVDDQLIRNLPAATAQTMEAACGGRINAAEAAANAAQPAASPQELQQSTQFAQCMRQHGWPNFPDPDAHGSFSSATPGATPGSKQDPSWQLCRSHLATTSK